MFGLQASGYRELAEVLAQASSVVVYSGSGLSADSGLPTYRGVGEHLWTPELLDKVARIDGFMRNAEFARRWYEEQGSKLSVARPHEGHAALAQWESVCPLVHVTQNVDRLLEQAGCHEVLHIHGAYDSARCMACNKEWTIRAPRLTVPCPRCGAAALRPGIVMQGEPPPQPVMAAAYAAARTASVVLVVGTPAEMYPGAAVVEAAHAAGVPVCVINPQWCENLYYARWQLFGGAREALPALLAEVRRAKAQQGSPVPWYLRWLF
jgi:NAD-dependent deacetylase